MELSLFYIYSNSQPMKKKRKVRHSIQMAWRKTNQFQMVALTASTMTRDSSKQPILYYIHSQSSNKHTIIIGKQLLIEQQTR